MGTYDEIYLPAVMKTQGKLFYIIRDELPGVDEKWFIEGYMRSRIRAMIDIGNPKYLNIPAGELLLRFIEDEMNGVYKKGKEFGGFLPEWVGKVYALYQWKYDIASRELIEKIPLDKMQSVFPALHQMGWEAAVERLYEVMEN